MPLKRLRMHDFSLQRTKTGHLSWNEKKIVSDVTMQLFTYPLKHSLV